MTALTCPACGYRLTDISDRTAPFVDCRCCDACRSIYLVDVQLSHDPITGTPDGVGPERLVPVEVGA